MKFRPITNKVHPSKTVEKTVDYQPGQCLHADLVPGTTVSRRKIEHYLLIKDEESSFRQVYFQKTKERDP